MIGVKNMVHETAMEKREITCADSCGLCKRSYYCKHFGEEGYICDRCVMDIDDGEIPESEIAGCIEDGVSPSRFYAD